MDAAPTLATTAPARFSAPPPRPLAATALAAAAALLGALLLLLLPALPVADATHDAVALFDGAYRIRLGLRPHIDFPVPFGPLALYLAALAEGLGAWGNPIQVLHALGMLLLLPPAVALALGQRGRRPAAAAIVLLPALFCLVPVLVEATDVTYMGLYNRWSSGALFLLLCFALTPRRLGWGQALLLAWLLALLVATKISAAVLGFAVVSCAALLSAPMRGLLLRVAGLLVAAALAVEATTGLVSAYARDVAWMIAANRGGLVRRLVLQMPRGAGALAAAAGLGWWLARAHALQRGGGCPARHPSLRADRILARLRHARPLLLLIVTTGAVAVHESQNSGSVGLALLAALCLLAVRQDAAPGIATLRAVLALAALGPWLATVAIVALQAPRQAASLVPDPAVAALLPGLRPPTYAVSYAERMLAAGAGLMRRDGAGAALPADILAARPAGAAPAAEFTLLAHSASALAALLRTDPGLGATPEARVISLTEVQPFPRLLGMRPADRGPIWLDPWRTLGPDGAARLTGLLAGADLIVVPTCPTPGGSTLVDIAAPTLRAGFLTVAAVPCWQLWRPRTAVTHAP